MKIIIGVLASDGQYKDMVEASRLTCYYEPTEGIEGYFIYGRRPGINIPKGSYCTHGDCFYYDWPEERRFILNKTMAFFHYCYTHKDFDYIFRTNCGSYLNLDLLKKHIKDNNLPRENIYLAMKNAGSGRAYGSGAGILFSRDVIKKLLDRSHLLQDGIDDVEFGKVLFEHYNLEVTPGALRKDIRFTDLQSNPNLVDDKCYHYYFRATRDPRCYFEVHKKTIELKSRGIIPPLYSR